MFVVILLLGFLIAFWMYVRWDGKRLKNGSVAPLARSTMEAGYTPRGASILHGYLGVGLLFALLAFMEWNAPSHPPFSGRMAFARAALFETFGSRGILTAYVAVAFAFFCASAMVYARGKR
jgi:hypothetical protein